MYKQTSVLISFMVMVLAGATALGQSPATAPVSDKAETVVAEPDTAATPDSDTALDSEPVQDTDTPDAAPVATTTAPSVQSEPSQNSQCANEWDCTADYVCQNARCVSVESIRTTRSAPVPASPSREIGASDKEGMFTLYFPVSIYWRNDSGYDFFTADPAFVNMGVGFDVDFLNLKDKWVFSAGATFLHEKAGSESVYGMYDTEWVAETFTASIKARYRVLSWLSPHARIYGGVSISEVEVVDATNELGGPGIPVTYTQSWTPAFVGGAGLGVSFHTPSVRNLKNTRRSPSFSAGVLLEGGYEFGSAVDVTFDLSEDGAHPIDTVSNSSGELERNAPYFRMEFYVRF